MQENDAHDHSGGRVTVARSSLLRIEACGCGVMHLHFGPLSIRFTQESLESVHNTISEALARVAHPEPDLSNLTSLFDARGPVRGEA